MAIRFNYPIEFTTLPEYCAHRGQFVRVVRQCTNLECDPACQPMYVIIASDGWRGHAALSELEDIPDMILPRAPTHRITKS